MWGDGAGRSIRDYRIDVFYSEQDSGYIANIPDLVACSAFGKTRAEALEQVEIAKSLWLEAARAEGKPFRQPNGGPLA
jgi:predicted RNase H-like HicB family nuclease